MQQASQSGGTGLVRMKTIAVKEWAFPALALRKLGTPVKELGLGLHGEFTQPRVDERKIFR